MKKNGKERKRVFGWDTLYGSRRIRDLLQREGYKVNRTKVQRLMGISALYPKRRTSLAEQGHRI